MICGVSNRCCSQVCSRGLQPAFRMRSMQHFGQPERGLKPATTYSTATRRQIIHSSYDRAYFVDSRKNARAKARDYSRDSLATQEFRDRN